MPDRCQRCGAPLPSAIEWPELVAVSRCLECVGLRGRFPHQLRLAAFAPLPHHGRTVDGVEAPAEPARPRCRSTDGHGARCAWREGHSASYHLSTLTGAVWEIDDAGRVLRRRGPEDDAAQAALPWGRP